MSYNMENILSSQTLVSLFFARLFTIDEAPTPTFFLYKNPGKLVLLPYKNCGLEGPEPKADILLY